MKKSIKIIIMLILLIAIMVIPTFISANTESKILKKSDKYLIYNENAMNEEFTFAFGEKENQEDLIYFPSAKDSSEEGAKNVAYIDETNKSYLNENSEAFLFIRDKEGKYIIKAEKINLKNAIDNEVVETTTKRIKVDTSKTNTTTQTINGVKNEVTTGKIVITDTNSEKYYYMIQVLNQEKQNDYTELMKLAKQINEIANKEVEEPNKMEKLEIMEKFYTIYKKLEPKANDTAWLAVENKEIMQPKFDTAEDEAKYNNQQYIVFIKNEDGSIIDAQFMTCEAKYTQIKEKETITIKETSKLPVTFDNLTTIIIIFAVIIVAIIIVLVIRKKANRKQD